MKERSLEIQIREARSNDGPALSALLRSIGWFTRMAKEPETATQQTIVRHLKECLDSPSHSIYVATDISQQLVGYVAVHWLPYLFLPGPEGFVSELFVTELFRGSGVGKSLLRTVEAEANDRKCARLHLINFRQRDSYRRGFYEKMGWEERPNGASFVKLINPT